MMQLEIQDVSDEPDVPSDVKFHEWVGAVLQGREVELVIRVVGEDEGAEFNGTYRNKLGPTNVLSFPFEAPPGVETEILGDLVICAPVVVREAIQQGKTQESHWAHLVVHGVLHLLGYDHLNVEDAEEMEAREVIILQDLGFPNPYEVVEA